MEKVCGEPVEEMWKLIFSVVYDMVTAYVYYVSAKETEKKERARIFQAHENKSGETRVGAKKKEGAQAYIGMSMLKKENRLLKNEDFSALLRKGRRTQMGFISLKVLKNALSYARVGFVVGGRIAKKSTARNLIKRRLRAALRAFEAKMRGGVDIAVLPSAAIMHKNFKDIEKEMREVFEKAHLL